MENPSVGRKKKSDKAKEKREKNPFSQKHVRLVENRKPKSKN
jgi:hypothetical protein